MSLCNTVCGTRLLTHDGLIRVAICSDVVDGYRLSTSQFRKLRSWVLTSVFAYFRGGSVSAKRIVNISISGYLHFKHRLLRERLEANFRLMKLYYVGP